MIKIELNYLKEKKHFEIKVKSDKKTISLIELNGTKNDELNEERIADVAAIVQLINKGIKDLGEYLE